MKMNTKMMWVLLPCSLVAGGLMLAGCSTDDSIDLDSIDSTVGVGSSEFKIPVGNSNKIPLSDVLDIDGSDCIDTTSTGDYYFYKADDGIAETKVKIDPVSVNLPTDNIKSFDFYVPILDLYQPSAPARGPRKNGDGDGYSYQHTITAFNFSEDNLTGDVRELDYAMVKPVPFSLTVKFSEGLKILSYFEGLQLELPGFLLFKDNQLSWENGSSRKETITVTDGLITLGKIYTDAPLQLKGYVSGLDFKNYREKSASPSVADQFRRLLFVAAANPANKESSVSMNGYIDINIRFKDAALNVDLTDPMAVITAFAGKTKEDFKITSTFTFGDASVPALQLEKVTGRFYPSIDLSIDPVKITNIPDFLNKNDVHINLHDLKLELDIDSKLPVTGIVDATLTPIFSNSTGAPVEIKHITIAQNKASKVLISRLDNSSQPGYDDYHWSGDSYGSGDISKLLSSIPKEIKFDCQAGADSTQSAEIELNKDFIIKPTYKIEAPLALEQGSVIVYDDDVDGWNEDLKDNDIDLSDNNYVVLEGDMENQTPLTLVALKPEPKDVNGNVLSDVKIEFLDAAGTVTDSLTVNSKATTQLKIKISTTSEALKKLDGMHYCVHAKAGSTVETLNANVSKQYVRIMNLKLSMNGQIVVTLDDDDKDDKKKDGKK